MEPDANVVEAVPFFGVTDIERTVRWYVEGLGFEMTCDWRPEGKLRWCSLKRGGASVMLQEFAAEGQGGARPEGELGAGVCVSFQCRDAVALYREFRARGIEARRPFVGNRMWVTTLRDPDGYRIEFESPTDAPEESELEEG